MEQHFESRFSIGERVRTRIEVEVLAVRFEEGKVRYDLGRGGVNDQDVLMRDVDSIDLEPADEAATGSSSCGHTLQSVEKVIEQIEEQARRTSYHSAQGAAALYREARKWRTIAIRGY